MNKKTLRSLLAFVIIVLTLIIIYSYRNFHVSAQSPDNINIDSNIKNLKIITTSSNFTISCDKSIFDKYGTPSISIYDNNIYITIYTEGTLLSLTNKQTVSFENFSNGDLKDVKNIYLVKKEASEIKNNTSIPTDIKLIWKKD